jgi:hypothetical protein
LRLRGKAQDDRKQQHQPIHCASSSKSDVRASLA